MSNFKWIQFKNVIPRTNFQAIDYKNGILVIGGSDGNTELNSVEWLDPSDDSWKSLGSSQPDLLESRSNFQAIKYKNGILVIGGINSNGILNSVEWLDPSDNNWKSLGSTQPNLNIARHNFQAIGYNGGILAIGGEDSGGVLNSVEWLDPSDNNWENINELNTSRTNFQAIEYNGKILVIGGFGLIDQLISVEYLDSIDNSWKPFTSMFISRANFEAIEYKNGILAIGKVDNFTNSVEWLDNGFWLTLTSLTPSSTKPNLYEGRSSFQALEFNGGIIVIGGINTADSIILNGCEWLNLITNNWQLSENLIKGRYNFQAIKYKNTILAIGGTTSDRPYPISGSVEMLISLSTTSPRCLTLNIPGNNLILEGTTTALELSGKVYVNEKLVDSRLTLLNGKFQVYANIPYSENNSHVKVIFDYGFTEELCISFKSKADCILEVKTCKLMLIYTSEIYGNYQMFLNNSLLEHKVIFNNNKIELWATIPYRTGNVKLEIILDKEVVYSRYVIYKTSLKLVDKSDCEIIVYSDYYPVFYNSNCICKPIELCRMSCKIFYLKGCFPNGVISNGMEKICF